MPRKWVENVTDFPVLRASVLYHLRVVSVDRQPGGKAMRVRLTHEDGGQEGRVHEVLLPLPVRPSGLTADFFRACGLNVSLGGRLVPQEVMDRVVGARLAQIGGAFRVVAFKPISVSEGCHDAVE